MILPGIASDLRTEFDSLCERLGVRPRVLAEVDDMATMRLLARDTDALVLVPSVVVREELREGLLHEMCMLPDLAESFYAITTDRRFQHPLLDELLQRDEAQLFQTPSMPAASQPASVQTAGVQPASAPRSSRRKSTGSKRPGTSL
jgi:LysR family transcriptional activator of nhaA